MVPLLIGLILGFAAGVTFVSLAVMARDTQEERIMQHLESEARRSSP